MIEIEPFGMPLTLFHVSGARRVFANKAQALNELGLDWINSNVGEHFVQSVRPLFSVERAFVCHEYIMRDHDGNIVVGSDFLKPSRNSYWRRYWQFIAMWNGCGPVPRTGKRKNGKYFRRMRCIGAKRDAEVFADEGEPPVRAKRKAANIPDSWDDFSIAANRDRNWKRHRKTQYRVTYK